MEITHEIALDLQQVGNRQLIYAKCGDISRTVKLHLYDGGTEFSVPDGAQMQIAYAKADGKGGAYSTLSSGTAACSASGNTVTAKLHPQMFSAQGLVTAELQINTAAGERLSTFSWYIMVQASAESGITSEDYWAVARTDKIVLLAASVGAISGATVTYSTSALFLSTPQVGDTVIGSDGYVAKVTDASGTAITIQATGTQWINVVPSTRKINGKDLSADRRLEAYDIPYQSNIAGADADNVRDALDTLNARHDVLVVRATLSTSGEVTSADKTFAEIEDAISARKEVVCILKANSGLSIFMLQLSALTASTAVFRALGISNGTVKSIELSLDAASEVWTCENKELALKATDIGFDGTIGDYEVKNTGAAIEALNTMLKDVSAEDVAYAGKVGSNTASTVSEALDALATGVPLDMSADYTASGAATVAAWATMVKTSSPALYRVAAGRYKILDVHAGYSYDVMIADTSAQTRFIKVVTCDVSGPFLYLSVYVAKHPTNKPIEQVYFSTEENLLEISGMRSNLPTYSAADAGKFLTIGTDGTPQWAPKPSYDAENITCQYTDIDGQNCDTVREALDAIRFDMGLLRPPHIMISLTSTSDGTIITGATKNGAAISLTNASGTADYTALLAAINSAVPKGGNVELCVDSDWYYSGAVYRNASGVIITYYDLVNPLEIDDGMSFYRCWITKTNADISVKEV